MSFNRILSYKLIFGLDWQKGVVDNMKNTVLFNNLSEFSGKFFEKRFDAARRVISSGWWLNGKETSLFATEFANYLGVEFCLPLANGTDALEIAMRTMGEVRGARYDEVVTVGNAGGYSSIACRLVGLKPVYADIDSKSLLMDMDSALSCVGSKTAFVVVTHLYGGVANVKNLRKMLDDAGHQDVLILEDCAQSHGAMLGEQKVGTLGDMATFSFYPTKNLGAIGDAGAIVSNNKDLIGIAHSLSQYGWTAKYSIDRAYGRNSRMDEIQAAFLRLSLPELDGWNARRIEIIHHYKKYLPSNVTVVESPIYNVAHLCVVQCQKRDKLGSFLKEHGVQTAVHYPIPDFEQPGWEKLPQRLAPQGVEITRKACENVLSLPCYPSLPDQSIDLVVKLVNDWNNKNK